MDPKKNIKRERNIFSLDRSIYTYRNEEKEEMYEKVPP